MHHVTFVFLAESQVEGEIYYEISVLSVVEGGREEGVAVEGVFYQ